MHEGDTEETIEGGIEEGNAKPGESVGEIRDQLVGIEGVGSTIKANDLVLNQRRRLTGKAKSRGWKERGREEAGYP